jgi:hypothetical protein
VLIPKISNDVILTAEVIRDGMKYQDTLEQCVSMVVEECRHGILEDTIRIYKEIFHKILQIG